MMTDNEIIQALECCKIRGQTCEECPYYSKKYCVEWDALDLINRQKEELDGKDVEIMNLKHEIERLKAEIRNTDNILNSLAGPLIEVKTEAYREFAERLKDMSEDRTDWGKPYVLCEDIDRLLERI